jgi:prepilin-type N-terminal cleavage/methylation domain-containing protein
MFRSFSTVHQKNRKTGKYAGGFSLVEVLVAASIISVSLLSVITLANTSLTMSKRSLNTYLASTLLEEGSEAIRSIRDTGWSNISGLSLGTRYYPSFSTGSNTWSLSTTPSTVGIFTRSVVFSAVARDVNDDITSSGGTTDTGTKLATITVTWSENGTSVSKTLQLYITDIFS